MIVFKAYKTEIDPNDMQRVLLAKSCGVARFTWNWGLAWRIEEYKATKKTLSAIDQQNQLSALKKTEFPWMYEVSKCAPQSALRDLDTAYTCFFRRVKAGQKPGFPKFKAKHRTTPSFRVSGKQEITRTHIRLPKMGMVRIKEGGYIPLCSNARDKSSGQKSITVKMSSGGRWFVSVIIEEEIPDPPKRGNEVLGIDLGLTDFAVTSDGDEVGHPKILKKKEKKLKRLKRRMSRRVKGGKNREKARKRLAVQHYKVACARKDFLNKLSSRLVKTKPVIVLEDLHILGMLKNRALAKAISDSGWGEFARQCKYKAEWAGGRAIVADRFFPSTKRCSCCGAINAAIELTDREWDCPICGAHLKRDPNAAANLKWYGERVLANEAKLNTGSSPGINACGEASSGSTRFWLNETSLTEAGSFKRPSANAIAGVGE